MKDSRRKLSPKRRVVVVLDGDRPAIWASSHKVDILFVRSPEPEADEPEFEPVHRHTVAHLSSSKEGRRLDREYIDDLFDNLCE